VSVSERYKVLAAGVLGDAARARTVSVISYCSCSYGFGIPRAEKASPALSRRVSIILGICLLALS